MYDFSGKVAVVTGGARGQGRAHAVRLAECGADVALVDICAPLDSLEYPMPTRAEMAETAELVQGTGRRALEIEADVRNCDEVDAAVTQVVAELGAVDFAIANAGVLPTTGEASRQLSAWHLCIDTMLSGVYYTLRAASAAMLSSGRGGSIVITSSVGGLRGASYKPEMLSPGQVGYNAAKHGVIGIMRDFAVALGSTGIRVNCIHPMGVRTPMVVDGRLREALTDAPAGWMANVLGVDLIEPDDVANAVLWLLSDAARYVTGVTLPIDAGTTLV
jgi:SDR family mycofactocin-dependent oxidoreductase